MRILYVIGILVGSLCFAGTAPTDMGVQSEVQGIFLGETEEQIDANETETNRLSKQKVHLRNQISTQQKKEHILKRRLKISTKKYEKVSRQYDRLYSVAKKTIGRNQKLTREIVTAEKRIFILQQRIKELKKREKMERQKKRILTERNQNARSILGRQKRVLKKLKKSKSS